jgi:hypothetical protein
MTIKGCDKSLLDAYRIVPSGLRNNVGVSEYSERSINRNQRSTPNKVIVESQRDGVVVDGSRDPIKQLIAEFPDSQAKNGLLIRHAVKNTPDPSLHLKRGAARLIQQA